VDRICPFLALAADHRTAVDGYDADHACHALNPADRVERARQSELCLSDSHRQCDRYLAFLAAHAADAADIPTPAPDAVIPRTRLVVEPEARRVPGMGAAPLGLSPRRWVVAGGVAVVGVAAAATAVAGGFGALGTRLPPGASSQASASPPVAASPIPSTGTLQSSAPTPQPTEPSPRPSRSAADPTTTPAPTTYRVQEGDTLNIIAAQFGTTAAAIRRANGLGSDVINIGQVLVIP
jgi:LysM repeat protein